MEDDKDRLTRSVTILSKEKTKPETRTLTANVLINGDDEFMTDAETAKASIKLNNPLKHYLQYIF